MYMFNWLYVNQDLQKNYDVLLSEFNKLTNQNLCLIEKNNELEIEIMNLNDMITFCNNNYNFKLQQEQLLIKEKDELLQKLDEYIKKLDDNLKYEKIKNEDYNYFDNHYYQELEKHQKKKYKDVLNEIKLYRF